MKSSSIPTSANDPDSAPMPAPIAAPRNGTKKISPNRKPQKAPQVAPAPAVPCSWWVLGFLSPTGHLTTAASSRVIICRSCRPCRAMSTLSAPPGSSNFSTDSVATRVAPFCSPLRMQCVPRGRFATEGTSRWLELRSSGAFYRVALRGRPGKKSASGPQLFAHQRQCVGEGRMSLVVPGRLAGRHPPPVSAGDGRTK